MPLLHLLVAAASPLHPLEPSDSLSTMLEALVRTVGNEQKPPRPGTWSAAIHSAAGGAPAPLGAAAADDAAASLLSESPAPPLVMDGWHGVGTNDELGCTGGQVWNDCGSPCNRTCTTPEPLGAARGTPRCECPRSAPMLDDGNCVAECGAPTAAADGFALADPGCAVCGCTVQYANGQLVSARACVIQHIYPKPRYDCQFAVQTGVLYLCAPPRPTRAAPRASPPGAPPRPLLTPPRARTQTARAGRCRTRRRRTGCTTACRKRRK